MPDPAEFFLGRFLENPLERAISDCPWREICASFSRSAFGTKQWYIFRTLPQHYSAASSLIITCAGHREHSRGCLLFTSLLLLLTWDAVLFVCLSSFFLFGLLLLWTGSSKGTVSLHLPWSVKKLRVKMLYQKKKKTITVTINCHNERCFFFVLEVLFEDISNQIGSQNIPPNNVAPLSSIRVQIMLHLIFLRFSIENPNLALIMLHPPDRERSVHQLCTRNIIRGGLWLPD